MFEVIDFLINLAHQVEVVGSDCETTLLKQVDKLCIIECKSCVSDLDSVSIGVKTEGGHRAELVFHLFRDPVSEVDDHSHASGFATTESVQKLLVELGRNIELAGVVTSSDGFDIPFNEVVLGHLTDKVDVNDNEKTD